MSLHSATVRDLDQITARVFDIPARSCGARVDAHRIDDTFVIDIDLPGVDPAGIDINADDHMLTVRAERKPAQGMDAQRTSAQQEDLRILAGQRPKGTVTRRALPSNLDTDRLEARYDDGVLTVRVPVSKELLAA